MDFFNNLVLGFSAALSLNNLLYAFVGCFLGTVIGILPGLGPIATMAMLMPFTFAMDPLTALIMLAGIFYGAQYGGSTTAILVNLPGEVSSVVTTLDGHKMAQKGRAGVALATAAIGSFFAGSVGVLVLAVLAQPLTAMAIEFGPAEYFALMTLGLVGAVALNSGSVMKAVAMTLLGILLGMVGSDMESGALRFTLGLPELWDGIEITILAIGLFAAAEIIDNLKQPDGIPKTPIKVSSIYPGREDLKRMSMPIFRGTWLGVLTGVLPGAGPSVASFMSYSMERRLSKRPEEFGHGAIEGVAGPEAANNAAAQTSFIPTLALGIPGSGSMALLLGALIIHNIQPGPQVITTNPTLFWGLVASMWIGNLMLLILNLPLVGLWVKLLSIPYRALYPAIIVFCCIGVYSVRHSTFDVLIVAVVGLAGYVFRQLQCPPAPLMLGFVLGPMMEQYFRRALVISLGDMSVFVTRPISLALLGLAAIFLFVLTFSYTRRRRELLSDS